MTDSVLDSPTYTDILNDGDTATLLSEWLDISYVTEYSKYWEKWVAQNDLDSTQKYIDDFIEMVKKIETENGTTVNVVYCLYIFSNTATQ